VRRLSSIQTTKTPQKNKEMIETKTKDEIFANRTPVKNSSPAIKGKFFILFH